jgi:hypothetical protein
MFRTELAESLLKHVCGHKRATEIVGDLLEDGKGPFGVWFAVMQVLLRWSWRWIVGVVAAAASSVALMICLAKIFQFGVALPTASPNNIWASATFSLSAVFVMNLCRFGLRDKVTGLAAALMLLSGLAFRESAAVPTPYLGLGIFIVLGLLATNAATRKPLLITLGAAITYAGIFGLLTEVFLKAFGLSSSTAIVIGLPCCWLVSLLCEARVLAETRRFVDPLPSR